MLVAVLVPPHARFLASRAARPLVTAGQQSLEIFCLGILLSALAHVLITELGYGLGLRLAVNALGIAIMLVAAQGVGLVQGARPDAGAAAAGGAGRRERRNDAAHAAAGSPLWHWPVFAAVLALTSARGGGAARAAPPVARAAPSGRRAPCRRRWSRRPPSLPHLAAAIRRRKPVRIVVIGGASTKGAAAGAPGERLSDRLQVALQKRFPDVPITVVNQGMPRQTARQMVRRFPAEVSEDEPALIIWEVGISDAVRGIDLDEFASALQAGIDLAKNRAIDLMLVDMQFSRRATTMIDFDRYLDTIRRVGEMNGVYVFPRFAVMRNWSDENVFDYEDVPESERARLAAQVYDCVGRALAEVIAKGGAMTRLAAARVSAPPSSCCFWCRLRRPAVARRSRHARPRPLCCRSTPTLNYVAAKLAKREKLTILAMGSSSTEGIGASSPAATYPSRLEAELRERFPAWTSASSTAARGARTHRRSSCASSAMSSPKIPTW